MKYIRIKSIAGIYHTAVVIIQMYSGLAVFIYSDCAQSVMGAYMRRQDT